MRIQFFCKHWEYHRFNWTHQVKRSQKWVISLAMTWYPLIAIMYCTYAYASYEISLKSIESCAYEVSTCKTLGWVVCLKLHLTILSSVVHLHMMLNPLMFFLSKLIEQFGWVTLIRYVDRRKTEGQQVVIFIPKILFLKVIT